MLFSPAVYATEQRMRQHFKSQNYDDRGVIRVDGEQIIFEGVKGTIAIQRIISVKEVSPFYSLSFPVYTGVFSLLVIVALSFTFGFTGTLWDISRVIVFIYITGVVLSVLFNYSLRWLLVLFVNDAGEELTLYFSVGYLPFSSSGPIRSLHSILRSRIVLTYQDAL